MKIPPFGLTERRGWNLQVVQSIIECPEPELPRADADGEPFTDEFHQFLSCCLKKDVRRFATNWFALWSESL